LELVFLKKCCFLLKGAAADKASGYNWSVEGTKKIELIDMDDPTNVRQPSSCLKEYPKDNVMAATGHLLTSNNSLICGGIDDIFDNEILDDCFSINENGIEATAKLLQARYLSASVVVNSNTLWLTGGYIDWIGGRTSSTEFVQLHHTWA
jgi:hypothetical protein